MMAVASLKHARSVHRNLNNQPTRSAAFYLQEKELFRATIDDRHCPRGYAFPSVYTSAIEEIDSELNIGLFDKLKTRDDLQRFVQPVLEGNAPYCLLLLPFPASYAPEPDL